jgi:hypothetical protein
MGFLSLWGLIEILGWFLMTGGLIGTKYYDNQRKSYFIKLKVIPNFTTVCPNCKKNLPSYYANICVFADTIFIVLMLKLRAMTNN